MNRRCEDDVPKWQVISVTLVVFLVCAAVGFGLFLVTRAHAREVYAGQFDDVDPATRGWFKGVKAKNGVPCCDIADGHLTDYKVDSAGRYFVPIHEMNDEWIPVPPAAVVLDAGNPYEKAVVWYIKNGTEYYIRCFVPTGGV